jgi:hypothetical protein
LLLVTHSNTLAMMTADDIFNELKAEPCSIPMLKRIIHRPAADADVELYSREFKDIRVRVMSVDAMLRRSAAEQLSRWCRRIQEDQVKFPQSVIPTTMIWDFIKQYKWAR